MKSFFIILTALLILLGFIASVGVVYYMNDRMSFERVEAE